jgi:hypothetical protein
MGLSECYGKSSYYVVMAIHNQTRFFFTVNCGNEGTVSINANSVNVWISPSDKKIEIDNGNPTYTISSKKGKYTGTSGDPNCEYNLENLLFSKYGYRLRLTISDKDSSL